MPKDWTDAEFEVVGEHYRPGEAHRDPKLRRWRYTGRRDAWGHPLWYRPPRLNRWQFGVALGAGALVAWVLFWMVMGALHLA